MSWKVRENQNKSSELTHYGVKGMKWGVVNKKETVSISKTKSSIDSSISKSGGGGAKSDEFVKMKKQLDDAINKSGLKLGSNQKISIDVSNSTSPRYIYTNGNKTLSYTPDQLYALINVASRDKSEQLKSTKQRMDTVKSQSAETMMRRNSENIKKAKDAMSNSKTVKKTLKQKLSDVVNSAKSTVKSGMDAVTKFIKNPLKVSKKTTVTRNTDDIKRDIVVAKLTQKKKK